MKQGCFASAAPAENEASRIAGIAKDSKFSRVDETGRQKSPVFLSIEMTDDVEALKEEPFMRHEMSLTPHPSREVSIGLTLFA